MSPITAVFSPMNRILITKVGNPCNIPLKHTLVTSQIEIVLRGLSGHLLERVLNALNFTFRGTLLFQTCVSVILYILTFNFQMSGQK